MAKILVIEDEESVRENLLDLLDAEDFEVLGADNGCTGVNLAQQHLPDLIICDVMMPTLDGFGVLSSLRQNPATAMIPFMFLTARADKTDLRQGMELGADDYLTKPFSRVELLGAISARLQKQAVIEQQQTQKLDRLRHSITLSLPHELRSPLTNILGFSQLLIEEADSLERQEIRQMSESIRKSAEGLHRLIQNFLLYAELELIATDPDRIEALRSSRTSSVAPLIEQTAVQQARRVGREADLQLKLQDSSIQSAKARLEKIVEELIDNALKYSAPGTPIQVVGTLMSHGKSAELFYSLSIADQGRGMSAAQIAELGAYRQFERQLYEQKGSGLGLIICKRLSELLGGELTVESTPNQPTKVRVVLPM
ncbi:MULTISPECIES: hybrid sensor histidine kinase/response regulator [unclassified Coleofasciculus]|uniref:hybrid sensor histidine kinase/response regulator n=1 Tax=unclassified Coleofasciculus TaxID=2692782 RepID=UPI00187F279E|nr:MULTISPECIES: hybrid sensor histidine kinase/response regulator [unclassified Coleofasciculus]MBE9126438.1 hybrid sensor histidine kinase/response regulator [Coleofasciculus sp. LEGE 07081]MBE9148040.1 hybrid sensor histidine kinase/response regulator [Coleofasciculus sp. LEGE 07092]